MGVRKEHHRYSRHITRTPRWKILRAAILERDDYACRSCGARGRLEVDHVKPVRTHPWLAWAPANLQALCPACHTAKTRIECGHPPPDPKRQQWRASVAELATPSKRRERSCLIL